MTFFIKTNVINKIIVILLFVFFGMSVRAAGILFKIAPDPVPIKLDQVGVVADFKFKVRDFYSYSYMLEFQYPENDKLERARIRRLLVGESDKTGKPLHFGVPTPIRLTIFAVCKDESEIEIYSQETDPMLPRGSGGAAGGFRKNIDRNILPPGIYRFRLENRRMSPEFNSIPVKFSIGVPAKVKKANFNSERLLIRSDPCRKQQ